MNIEQKLLAWYKKNGRDLPWRKTQDPYKILVSEIMLQQTQVARVLLYYKTWLKQFPNWKTLAAASNADVIKAWAGLGYNRRALVLRDIAREIASSLRSSQRQSSNWLEFKGIGPYTAAALAIFTGAERIMPIDTNIRRVLDRALLGVPFPDPKLDDKLKSRTLKLLKTKDFDLVPQALFDLATTICKKVPDCAVCPLRNECKSAPRFLAGKVPVLKAMIKKSRETIHRNKKYPDRIYRGRILTVVREARAGVTINRLGPMIDPAFDRQSDQAWLLAMIARMRQDKLLTIKNNRLCLL